MDDFKPQQQTPPQKPDEPQGFTGSNPDNVPETYVTPEGTPTTLGEAHAEPQAQTVVASKKSGAKKWLLGGVAVLLLAALSALAYWQWAEAQNARDEVASLRTTLEAAEKKAQEDTEKDEDDSAPTTAPLRDTDLVKAEVDSFLASTQNNSYVYSANNVKIEDTFAIVKAVIPSSDANPKTIVLEKSKENWVVVYSIVGPVPAADKDKLTAEFGIPKTLLAE